MELQLRENINQKKESAKQLKPQHAPNPILDKRLENVIQTKRQDLTNNSNQVSQLKSFQNMADKPIQRKIIYNYGMGQFGHNGRRPHWRSSLKTWTAMVYNWHKDLRGEGHLPNITGKSNIGAKGLARTHKIPFHQLQIFLEDFCNGIQNPAQLATFTNLVVKATSPAHGNMAARRLALINARVLFQGNASANNRFAVIRTANQLLTELHNSIDNVLIGESGRNSAIGAQGDWNIATTPGGTGVLTPISSEAAHTLSGSAYDPGLYRPGGVGGNIYSSHITSNEPTALHLTGHSIRYTTREWRGPGIYQNGVINTLGGMSPAGTYLAQP